MPSPFPGMNPWLEQEGLWQDFHTKFLVAVSERLVPQVGPNYFVLLEHHIYVHEPPDERTQCLRADLLVTHSPSAAQQQVGAVVLDAPAQVEHPVHEVERVPFLEVRHAARGDLVTVLELLSPSNKQGENRQQYLTKREQLLNSETHLVEIDLLRGGESMPDTDRPACDYSVLVSRWEHRPRAGFWPVQLRERLPEVPIPLRRPDGDARVDLQEVLHRVYDASGYVNFIYRGSATPPLRPEDAEWARQFPPCPTGVKPLFSRRGLQASVAATRLSRRALKSQSAPPQTSGESAEFLQPTRSSPETSVMRGCLEPHPYV